MVETKSFSTGNRKKVDDQMEKSMSFFFNFRSLFCMLSFTGLFCLSMCPSETVAETDRDKRIKDLIDNYRWRDMNVPKVDGQTLHDIIIENGYTRALEIGTSTGHSGIWIAWALSKTGGRLITIDIDQRRHRIAKENFEKAGLSQIIDARLGNAHELVPALEGPFDFVFSDADKSWYKNYLLAVLPKLEVGGCYTTHNVSRRGWNSDYAEFLFSLPNLKTTIDNRGGGLAISYKISE